MIRNHFCALAEETSCSHGYIVLYVSFHTTDVDYLICFAFWTLFQESRTYGYLQYPDRRSFRLNFLLLLEVSLDVSLAPKRSAHQSASDCALSNRIPRAWTRLAHCWRLRRTPACDCNCAGVTFALWQRRHRARTVTSSSTSPFMPLMLASSSALPSGVLSKTCQRMGAFSPMVVHCQTGSLGHGRGWPLCWKLRRCPTCDCK